MKKNGKVIATFVFATILFSQVLAGCSDNGSAVDPAVSQLSGSWIWVRSEGGFFPRVLIPPAGTIVKDYYSPGGIFSRRRNDTIVVSARYAISERRSGLLLTFTDINSFFGYDFFAVDEWLQFKGDTLWLIDNGMDLYRHTFVRAKW